MPTGYTFRIEEGLGFEEFILDCARAFTPCISVRDEPRDKPIPEEFKESNYSEERYNKAVKEFEKYNKMSIEEADIESAADYSKETNERMNRIKEINRKENLYIIMLDKVKLWEPPTLEHIELKNFMIQQIDISMDKGSIKEYYSEQKIIKLSGQQWLHEKIKTSKENVEYYMKNWKEETKRTASSNEWIKQLRDSI